MGEIFEKRKIYSKLTAQIVRNSVRKKINAARAKGQIGAEELLSDLFPSHKTAIRDVSSSFDQKIGEIIEKNKKKWCDFITNAAKSFDPEALSVFGTNFVYSSLITDTIGGTPWLSLLEVGEQTEKRISSVAELIYGAQSRRSFAWIVKGRGVLSPKLINLYASFPDSAFMIALPESEFDSIKSTTSINGLKNIKNSLILVERKESGEKGREMTDLLQRNGILCALSADRELFELKMRDRSSNFSKIQTDSTASDSTAVSGRSYPKPGLSASASGGNSSGIPLFLSEFLSDPRFPLEFDGIKALADNLEFFFSGGKRHSVPKYLV